MLEVKQGPYSEKTDKVKFDSIDESKIKIRNKNFIPVSEPLITKDDIKAVAKTVKSDGYHLLAKKLKILKEIFLDFKV